MNKNTIKILLTAFLLFISVVAITARFFYLEADFPQGLTWEGALYTDEGMYANGAIFYAITGNWTVEGDFNLVFHVPVFNLLMGIVFKIAGLSLFTARATVITCYILIIVLSYLLVRKYSDSGTALMTVVLLSVNFTLFAYSRLAINVVPMFSIGFFSMFIVLYFPARRYLVIGSIAALIFFLAYLTKPTAMLLLPALFYTVYIRQERLRDRIYACLWVLGILILCFFVYQGISEGFYPEDHLYLSSRTSDSIISRFTFNPLFIFNNIARTFQNGVFLDALMFPLTITLIFFPVFFLLSKHYRENPLIGVCFVWLCSYFSVLSLCRYQPHRYYLPLIIPITMLFSMITVALYRSLKPSRWAYLPVIVMGLIVITNCSRIISYLQAPKYSFLTMAQDIQYHVNREYSQDDAILLGSITNSLSLATGIHSINEGLGTRDLRWRLSRYQPTHYVSLGINPDILDTLAEFYDVEQLATYDVFGNYYAGQQVHFYRLTKNK